jgi:YD repeat-containing protein
LNKERTNTAASANFQASAFFKFPQISCPAMLSRKNGNVTSYAYDANTDLVTSVSSGSSAVPYTYGNGTRIGFVYDNLDRLTEKKYNDATKVTYHYNKMGQLMYYAFKRQ